MNVQISEIFIGRFQMSLRIVTFFIVGSAWGLLRAVDTMKFFT